MMVIAELIEKMLVREFCDVGHGIEPFLVMVPQCMVEHGGIPILVLHPVDMGQGHPFLIGVRSHGDVCKAVLDLEGMDVAVQRDNPLSATCDLTQLVINL